MSLLNFIVAVMGITIVHLVLAYVYNIISHVFPFIFGGLPTKQEALYKQMEL